VPTPREAASLARRTPVFDWRTAERRDGYYIGTDQPHTDEWGFPRSPLGAFMPSGLATQGYAYFIQHEDGGPIKIGTSIDCERRLRDLNVNSHDPRYRLLASVEGGRNAENDLHIRFRRIRVHGEWFLPDPELLDYIAGLPDA